MCGIKINFRFSSSELRSAVRNQDEVRRKISSLRMKPRTLILGTHVL